MFELVIPVAGQGSRFTGTTVPKPLIKATVTGTDQSGIWSTTKTLLDWSMDCLPMELVRKVHFVTNNANNDAIEKHTRHKWGDKVDLSYVIDEKPKGQAASALLGIENCTGPMIIANCDQWVEPRWQGEVKTDRAGLIDSGPLYTDWTPLYDVLSGNVECTVPTFDGSGSKWSYLVHDLDGDVACLVEKPYTVPKGAKAIVGIFVYHEAAEAEEAIRHMMTDEFRVRGEYYIAPSINYLVRKHAVIHSMECRMHGIGTPEDVAAFKDFTF